VDGVLRGEKGGGRGGVSLMLVDGADAFAFRPCFLGGATEDARGASAEVVEVGREGGAT